PADRPRPTKWQASVHNGWTGFRPRCGRRSRRCRPRSGAPGFRSVARNDRPPASRRSRPAIVRSTMNPSRIFIERPIATSLLMVAILLAGLVAYRLLPVSALPEVDYPTIQVTTLYPGASPDVIASSVTAPLERQFGQMPGLTQMSSSSSGGASVITLRFEL